MDLVPLDQLTVLVPVEQAKLVLELMPALALMPVSELEVLEVASEVLDLLLLDMAMDKVELALVLEALAVTTVFRRRVLQFTEPLDQLTVLEPVE